MEDVLFRNQDMQENAVVVAVKVVVEKGEKVVGFAFADVSTRRFGVCDFIDSDNFFNLEVALRARFSSGSLLSSEPLPKKL